MKTDPSPVRGKQTFLKVTQSCELMKFLQEQMPDKSRNTVKSLLAHRQVYVGRKAVTQFNHPLEAGQEVVVNWSKVQLISPKKGLKVVFEDPYIIVIEKQPGLLCVATDKEKERTVLRILSDQARRIDPKSWIFLVHRLDREASGLMIFAKDKQVQQGLMEASAQGLLRRDYVAVVQGCLEKDSGSVVSWLKENKAYMVYSTTVARDGRRAVTRYRVMRKSSRHSLVKIMPETDRKNQIRVHMKDLGHPVVGDRKYGAEDDSLCRLALHANVLAFRHPVTGEDMQFETPVPGKFLRLFDPEGSKIIKKAGAVDRAGE